MVDAYLTGIFPRSEGLIATTRAYDRKRASKADVEEKLAEDIDAFVRLQREAGLVYLTDGLLNWQDLFRPIVEAWDGLSAGALTRWFDNNTFFRQPVIETEIQPHPLGKQYFRRDLASRGEHLKAILPGPYTFTRLAEDRHYGRPAEALMSIAEGMSDVCSQLAGYDYAHIQFSEPGLVVDPPAADLWSDVKDAYTVLRSATEAELSVQVFFAPMGPITPHVLELPVDIVGVDVYQEDVDQLSEADFDKGLACGCVDSRNSLLETPEEIAAVAAQMEDNLEPTTLILCPNSDLELLPRTVAEEKVRALGRACSLMQEEA